jgi:hypothetical protein
MIHNSSYPKIFIVRIAIEFANQAYAKQANVIRAGSARSLPLECSPIRHCILTCTNLKKEILD